MKSVINSVMPQATMVDYPGRLSGLMFTSGCNFHCGFCHNAALLHNEAKHGDASAGTYDFDKLDEFLKGFDVDLGNVVSRKLRFPRRRSVFPVMKRLVVGALIHRDVFVRDADIGQSIGEIRTTGPFKTNVDDGAIAVRLLLDDRIDFGSDIRSNRLTHVS